MSELKKPDGFTVVWLKATKAQERQLEFTGSAKIACAKGLFAGETGLVGFCVAWTREELVFMGFLLSLFLVEFPAQKKEPKWFPNWVAQWSKKFEK